MQQIKLAKNKRPKQVYEFWFVWALLFKLKYY